MVVPYYVSLCAWAFWLLVILAVLFWPARAARVLDSVDGHGIMLIAASVSRGTDWWPAREPGECVSCGHDWIAGEMIGPVMQQYARRDDGTVYYSPAVRRACCVCVERARVQGDASLVWAREAGVKTGARA